MLQPHMNVSVGVCASVPANLYICVLETVHAVSWAGKLNPN